MHEYEWAITVLSREDKQLPNYKYDENDLNSLKLEWEKLLEDSVSKFPSWKINMHVR